MRAPHGERVDRVVHICDDSFEYPVGLRLQIHDVRSPATDVRVELDPHGAYRVVACERAGRDDAKFLRLGLQRVPGPTSGDASPPPSASTAASRRLQCAASSGAQALLFFSDKDDDCIDVLESFEDIVGVTDAELAPARLGRAAGGTSP